MSYMNIFLVRHGQDDESVRGGWCNHGLMPEGIEQSQKLGEELAHTYFDNIFSSDLNRAKETAEIIVSNLDVKTEIEYTKELREINNGLLAGMKNELAEKEYPGLYYKALQYDKQYPLGESPKEFYQRILNFWNEKLLHLNTKNILIVTHGGVINILLHLFNDIPYSNKVTKFPVKTGSVTKIKL